MLYPDGNEFVLNLPVSEEGGFSVSTYTRASGGTGEASGETGEREGDSETESESESERQTLTGQLLR